MLDRCCGVDEVARFEVGAALDQLAIGERLEGFAELAGRIDDQCLERDDRGTPCFHGRIAGDLDLSDHF